MSDVVGTVVGAPEPTENIDYLPLLDGFGPDKVVTVFNPLSQDFRVQFSRPIAANQPLSPGMQVARERAGLDLSKEQGIQGHAVQYHVLKAGKSENLPGDIAQMAVRQLTNHILMSTGKNQTKKVADPQSRKDTEKEIVLSITDNTTFFNQAPVEVPDPPPGQGASYEPTKVTK